MTIIDNMLKMKKMNGLKIFALILLSLSEFKTMFGMKGDNIENNIDDEYVNKNYYLIDDCGNKITLDNGDDIKFKIYSEKGIKGLKCYINKDILKIHEKEKEKTLVTTISDDNNEEITYLAPIPYMNEKVLIGHKEKDKLSPVGFTLKEEDRKKYEKNTICCRIVKKIGEDSINDDYILVDAKNNKIEKINGKNIVFKLLTRKKYLELKEKLDNPENFLKNDKEKYILDYDQNPLFFEEVEKDLILYVTRSEDNLCLARLDLVELITTINFDKYNSIEVRMVKKEEIPMGKKKVENDDSSKCCCGIC